MLLRPQSHCMLSENAITLRLMCSQCVPDHLCRCFGLSDHRLSSMRFKCFYFCTFMWLRTIILQFNHSHCILMQGVNGISVGVTFELDRAFGWQRDGTIKARWRSSTECQCRRECVFVCQTKIHSLLCISNFSTQFNLQNEIH